MTIPSFLVFQMLRNVSSPESIGAGLAMALLCPFYSIILYGISESFVNVNRKKKEYYAGQTTSF